MTLTREKFSKMPEDFRIGLIISDGMWYSLPKWRSLAGVSEKTIKAWIDEYLSNGMLIQSENSQSYRFPLTSVKKWYRDHGFSIKDQLVDFIFPPRVWDDETETEGFLSAPLREIGIVSFSATPEEALTITETLRGIARVREFEPGRYKAYCLSASYVREIIEDELTRMNSSFTKKIYSRAEAKRREMSDFSKDFSNGLVLFYKDFGRTLVKNEMETIKIFLPDPEDQDSQILMWVLAAIEKFDESKAVPFSGYLNSVLKRWPYDLPTAYLGKDLSGFQRQRSKALKRLKKNFGEHSFTTAQIADEMGMEQSKFADLEEKHRTWTGAQNATTLTWDENSDEKMVRGNVSDGLTPRQDPSDIHLIHKLSLATIQAGLNTGLYDDAFSLISQVDSSELNMSLIQSVSEDFIRELGQLLGMNGEDMR